MHAIDPDVLALLCDPDARHALEWDDGNLRNAVTGRIYPVQNGMPLFPSTVSGANLRNMRIHDLKAPFHRLRSILSGGNQLEAEYRRGAAEELAVEPGMRVLDVGIGDGAMVQYLPAAAEIYGLDISVGMLKACQRNLARWRRQAHLFQGEGCKLPFRIEVFDRILQVGGIHRFANPARSIREMVWVAKPGARIVIADRAVASNVYDARREEGTDRTLADAPRASGPALLSLIPPEVTVVNVRMLDHGRWFCITLQKPENLGV